MLDSAAAPSRIYTLRQKTTPETQKAPVIANEGFA